LVASSSASLQLLGLNRAANRYGRMQVFLLPAVLPPQLNSMYWCCVALRYRCALARGDTRNGSPGQCSGCDVFDPKLLFCIDTVLPPNKIGF